MNLYRPEGKLILTQKNREILNSQSLLVQAYEEGTVLEALAAYCDPSHNIIVDIPAAQAVIPREKGAIGIAEGKTRDIAILSKVNKPVCFVIENISRDGKQMRLTLSRLAAQRRCADEYISGLHKGDIIPAKVTHLEPFGAFVDIGCGIPSLIPIDAISVSRISHPADRFYNGQDIFAVVKDMADDKISLTHKELLGTWKENCERFGVGETVPGIVRSVESYGIFIELAPNLAGLAEPKDGVRPGQTAVVNIKAIIPDKMKIKLGIVDISDTAAPLSRFKYFLTAGNLSKWRYSPEGATKEIATVFQ